MATALKLKLDIKKLKAAINSKATPKSFLPKLRSQLEKSEKELEEVKKTGKPPKKSTTSGNEQTLTALQKLIQKKKYRAYQGQGVDLEKDAKEGAFATGRRVSKGLKANQYGDKKDNKGNVYYEYRPNRLDVKQPKKAQKYPKLEKGGLMDRIKAVKAKYSGGGMSDRYSTEVGDEQITVSVGGKEKTGYPVYAKVSGYAPKTVGVFPTKEAAEKKAMQLEKKNKLEDGGYMEKGGKTPLGIARNTDYIVALELPYRIDFYKKTDKKGTGLGSIMVNQSDGKWSVKERKYSDTKGGYYDELVQGLTKDDALNFVSKMINKKMANGGYMARGGEVKVGDEVELQNGMIGKIIKLSDSGRGGHNYYVVETLEKYGKDIMTVPKESIKKMADGGMMAKGGYMEDGGSIGFIPMDLEEKLAITARWGGTNIKGVIGFLNAMIDSNLTDDDLKPNPTKNTLFQIERAEEKKIQEIWEKIKPKYTGGLEGNRYYSIIKRLVQRSGSDDNILKRFRPFRKYQKDSYEHGGYMAKGGEIYKIQQKYKYDLQPKWENEKFQTGGRYFLSFKQAQDFKKKLQDLSSSMEYKVVKVEDKMADGGELHRMEGGE